MTKIQLRRDTAANWSTNNPTPLSGEPCFETDTGKLKIGDGTTAYTQLEYFSTGRGYVELCDIGMALYVDETKGLRRYLNGQIVDINTNTQAFLNRLKDITTLHPSLLCTEEEWQTAKTMSAFGQVGKFVFNYSGDDIVSVRLPRVVNVQGLFDLQNLGMTVSAGLPNITGTAQTAPGRSGYIANGALDEYLTQNATNVYSSNSTATSTQFGISFNASRSNPIYGNSDTVQQEAIQYPYFIQIAKGSETENNIINEIELNNPYSLFDSKYSDHELNNLSWLKSEGQWNAKAVYPTAYDDLLREYNSPDRLATFNKDAFTVVGNPTITDEGVASGFSSNGYVKSKYKLEDGKIYTFRLEGIGGTPRTDRGSYIFSALYGSGSGDPNLRVITEAKTGIVRFALGNNKDVYTKTVILNGVKYKIELKTDFKTFVTFTDLLTGYTLTKTGYSVTDQTYRDNVIYYGSKQGVAPLTDGSIDLKHFSITVDGVKVFSGAKSKVKLSTEEYTDYDFVLNTTDETFRLPLLDGSEDIPSDRYDDLELLSSGSTYTAPANGYFELALRNSPNGRIYFNRIVNNIEIYGIKYTTEYNGTGCTGLFPVSKNDTINVGYSNGTVTSFRFIYAKGNGNLYYYVGETVQNANLIDAGRIGEQLATKTDMLQASGAGMPSSKYIDLSLGASDSTYTAPANGYFYINKEGSLNTYAVFWNTTINFGTILPVLNNGNANGYLPCRKGDVVKVTYSATGTVHEFRFIYAVGSSPTV